MLENIFYFIGFLLIPFSILRFYKSQEVIKISDWIHKFKKVTGKSPEIKDFKDYKEWKFIAGIGVISILESFWTVIGLLDNKNWQIFLFLLIFGTLSNLVNKQPFMIVKKIVMTKFFFVKMILLILLVFNNFHGSNSLLSLLGF
jgi:hypothetical protein